MIRDSFDAMGTTVIVVGGTESGLATTRELFAQIERVASRFDADSELSWLNGHPGGTVAVSPTLAAMLTCAQDLYDRTGGLVDPAVGASVAGWGYDTTYDDIGDLSTPPQPRPIGPWSIEGDLVTRAAEVSFDLGGIAKGWTCDRAIESGLAQLVSAGGDMRSSTPDAIAEIAEPRGDGVAARVAVGVGALATSSTTRRTWAVGSEMAHHIMDPRTAGPAHSPILSATVSALTAVEAEAGAKAVLIGGQDGLAWADTQDWITGALACWHSGAVFATGSLEMAA